MNVPCVFGELDYLAVHVRKNNLTKGEVPGTLFKNVQKPVKTVVLKY